MPNVSQLDDGDEVVGERVHVAAITKLLWGVASTLVGAFVIAAFSFAWSVNSNCVEFRQALATIRENDVHMAADLDKLRERLDAYPPSAELVGLRADVSQLQYITTTSTQTLNELTQHIRDLHPWAVSPRGQAPSAPNP